MAEQQAQQVEAEPINVNAQAVAIQPLPEFNPDSEVGAQTCSFSNVDFEIEQQKITAGTSTRIRKKALRDPTYNLKAILINGHRAEPSW